MSGREEMRERYGRLFARAPSLSTGSGSCDD
jgi:hypothetical protein